MEDGLIKILDTVWLPLKLLRGCLISMLKKHPVKLKNSTGQFEDVGEKNKINK